MPTPAQLLHDRLTRAFEAVAATPVDPVLRRSQHADFQADGALALARRLGRPPRELAAEIAGRADLAGLASVEVSGPGFINITLDAAALGPLLAAVAADERLGVPAAEVPYTVVVDYSGPNVAKEMHVGHLRSTVLGDAAVRLLEWRGHHVVRANHLGDWGTPFGMLIEHLLAVAPAAAESGDVAIEDLDAFYKDARAAFDADDAVKERARRRVVALQSGDGATLRLWRLLVATSERYFTGVYERLGVRLTPQDFTGESFYDPLLEPVVAELDRLGLLKESDGAQVVYPRGFAGRDGRPLPLIVRKRDGGFGYGATDLAAIRYRLLDLRAERLLYVVGSPQHLHLEMVFATAREAGWLVPPATAEHVAFGSVLGTDGRMLRSRAGSSVKLADLLDEAAARAAALVAERDAERGIARGIAERADVARAVGIGALKYADLSSERTKDYVFDWDRMLALEGNTGPYLQYAHARARSIFRRSGAGAPPPDAARVAEPAERALALELLAAPDVVAEVERTSEFHTLTGYLFGVATAFSAFYEQCPVLKADDPVRSARLLLCDVTARVLARGLDLLGIEAPDAM